MAVPSSPNVTSQSVLRSEDALGRKYDRYLSNCIVKMGTGLAVGTVFSLFLFRRRPWPVVFGLGTGFGFATNDLQHDLNAQTYN